MEVLTQEVKNVLKIYSTVSAADKPSTNLDEVPHYGGPPGLFKKGDWACTQLRIEATDVSMLHG